MGFSLGMWENFIGFSLGMWEYLYGVQFGHVVNLQVRDHRRGGDSVEGEGIVSRLCWEVKNSPKALAISLKWKMAICTV